MTPRPGRLAVVLHSHMPYVEGFGTWPFGEEWLFEAMATSYLPLLELLRGGAPITLSVTPVLADQLEAPGVGDRFLAFLRDIRRASHALDVEGCRASGRADLADELERAAGHYRWAEEHHEPLAAALAPYAAWTSSATHAVLPLLATDAGVRLQLRTGIDAHRARFQPARPWRGGFWLPECAYAPWLDGLLEEAGVHAACVDLTDVLGRGAPEQLRPIATEAGPVLVPIDREVIELVWSDGGYPSHAAYRDYHHRTTHDHHPWAVDGSVYDAARAAAQARADAEDFVARVQARVAGGGLCVCALDTELLGHWWHEGVAWLGDVVDAADRAGLELVHLDDALADIEPAPPLAPERLGTTTWGTPRDLSTWDAPRVAPLAWQARAAELAAVAAAPGVPLRAVRELLALQASDWAFIASRELAGEYPVERARGHRDAFERALAGEPLEPELRNLAPFAHPLR